MRGRKDTYGATAWDPYEDLNLRNDFELDELENDEVVTIYDVDTVLGYTVDVFKVGFPFLFLIALFLSLILMFGVYI
jgi:hypothetical protein